MPTAAAPTPTEPIATYAFLVSTGLRLVRSDRSRS